MKPASLLSGLARWGHSLHHPHLPTVLCTSAAHLSHPRDLIQSLIKQKSQLVLPLGELLRGQGGSVRPAQVVFSPDILKPGPGTQSPSLLAPWWEQVYKSTTNYNNVRPLLSRDWYLLKWHENIKLKEHVPVQDTIRLFHSFLIKFTY